MFQLSYKITSDEGLSCQSLWSFVFLPSQQISMLWVFFFFFFKLFKRMIQLENMKNNFLLYFNFIYFYCNLYAGMGSLIILFPKLEGLFLILATLKYIF